MVIYDFSQYILQRLVRGFRQAVGLRVVWRALLVDDRVIVYEPVDDLIEEMGPLVIDQLDGTPETAPDVFL